MDPTIRPDEAGWVRELLRLLRDPNPEIGELARQAVLYVRSAAERLRLTQRPRPETGARRMN